MSNLQTETIQVAAVATAMVEDLNYGVADSSKLLSPVADNHRIKDPRQNTKTITSPVLSQVFKERQRQDEKWGPQHHDPLVWLMILMEEVGELAEEVLGDGTDLPTPRSLAIEMAFLGEEAKAWLEHSALG